MKVVVSKPSINPQVVKIVGEFYHHLRDHRMRKIEVIKSLRTVFGLGLREAKDLFEIVIEDRSIEETVWGD